MSEADADSDGRADEHSFSPPRNPGEPSSDRLLGFLEGPYAEEADEFARTWTKGDPGFEVDWRDLYDYDADLAWGVIDDPESAIAATWKPVVGNLQEALADLYNSALGSAPVRLSGLPPTNEVRVGDLRTEHLGTLVDVDGKVVGVDNVEPWVKRAKFECRKCTHRHAVKQNYGDLFYPPTCEECEILEHIQNPNHNDYEFIREGSTLVDYQFVGIEPAGSSLEDPPTVGVVLKRELVGVVQKGDEITVTGVYETSPLDLQRESQLNTYVEAVALDVDTEREADKMPQEELDECIRDAMGELEDEGDEFGVNWRDVVDHVSDEHDVRKQEVENRVTGGFADDYDDIGYGGGNLYFD